MQVRSSKLRIASLRKNFGALIGATESKEDDVSNPFMPSGAQTASAMSLSVYNKPASLARPKTAKIHIGPWGPTTFDPNAVVAEGEAAKPAVEEAPAAVVDHWKEHTSAESLDDLKTFFKPDTNSAISRNLTQEIWDEYKDMSCKAGVTFKTNCFSGVAN